LVVLVVLVVGGLVDGGLPQIYSNQWRGVDLWGQGDKFKAVKKIAGRRMDPEW